MKNFSERLRERMEAGGLSQAELARRMDTTQSTVSRWLAGSVPHSRALSDLCVAINVRKEWLLNGDGEMLPESEPSHTNRLEDYAPTNPIDFRKVLEDVILLSTPEAVREMLHGMVKEFEAGDMRRAGRFSILVETIRRLRPEILAIPKPVAYSEKKPEPETEP